MSKNILIRSGTSPYDKYTTSEYLNKDLGGGNSGNLLFAASLFRNINNSERICFSNYYNLSLSSIDYVNQNYSCFIIPLVCIPVVFLQDTVQSAYMHVIEPVRNREKL